MSHEINDSANRPEPEKHQGVEALFLKVHEGEKAPSPIEDAARRLEAGERAIAEALERVADLARRAVSLQFCDEPYHFETLKDYASKRAEADEPAYKAFYNHLH